MRFHIKASVLLFIIGALLLTAYAFRLESLALFLWPSAKAHSSNTGGLQLSGYQVSIDAKPLPGLTDASGLTYHAPSNTLFAVLNQEPVIVQLSLEGEILQKIRVEGVTDMEDIAHIRDQMFVLVDEHQNRLFLVDLTRAKGHFDVRGSNQIALGFDRNGNKNFEGVSWDHDNHRLIVAKERDPKRLLEIRGFVGSDQGNSLEIRNLGDDYPSITALRDLAAVHVHRPTGHLLVLSEESKLIKEFDNTGQHLSSLLLWSGFHGIEHNVPQPEGITVGPDNSLYVISEPNLFYVFTPSPEAGGTQPQTKQMI